MSSDADVDPELRRDEVNESTLMWRRLTKGYKFADDLDHETLSTEFTISEEEAAREICSEAFSYVMDAGRARFEFTDFERAVDAVQSERDLDESDDDVEESSDDLDSDPEPEVATNDQESDDVQETEDPEIEIATETEINDEPDQPRPGGVSDVETIEVPREEFEQLTERVDELEGFINRDFALLKGSLRRLLDVDEEDSLEDLPGYAAAFTRDGAADDRIERLEEDNRRLEERLQVLETNLTSQQSGKFQKHAKILEFADNKRSKDQSAIAIVNEDVVGCVGCSRKYAYDLMEEMAETYSFATLRNHETIPNRSSKLKAVVIEFGDDDFDELLKRVHTNEGSN